MSIGSKMKRFFPTILSLILGYTVAAQQSSFVLAEAAFEEQNWPRAIQLFAEAKTSFESSGDLNGILRCENMMAACELKRSDYMTALALSENTLAKFASSGIANNQLYVHNLLIKGECLLNLGRNSEALQILREAEVLLDGDISLDLSNCFSLIGLTYWNSQNTERAQQYLEQSLAIRTKLLAADALPIADAYNNLGLVYVGNNTEKAAENFSKAIDLYSKLLGEHSAKVGYTLLNLAKVWADLGWYDEALEMQEKAMDIWNKVFEAKAHPAKAYTISVRGQIYLQRKQYSEALKYYRLSLDQYVEIFGTKHPEVANTYFQIGTVLQEQSNFKDALLAYQQAIYANLPGQSFQNNYALPVMSGYLNADYLLSALMAKAKILEAIHFEKSLKIRDIKAAIDTYLAADSLISSIRQIREAEADKLKLGAMAQLIYENGIRLALYLADQPMFFGRYKTLSFQFCERSKAALLLSAIQESQAKSFAGIPDQILYIEDSLKKTIVQLQQLVAKGNGTDQISKQLFDTERAYRAHLTMVERQYPSYFNLKNNSNPSTLVDLQSKLANDQMLISYFESTDQLYSFHLTKKKLDVVVTDKPQNWTKLILGMRNAIYYRMAVPEEIEGKMFSTIFSSPLPKNINHLTIIPSGQLYQVPFDALRNVNSGKYLLEDFAISYAYAATLWANSSKANNLHNSLLAIAPVTFDGHTPTLATLSGTLTEVQNLKYSFSLKGLNADVLTSDEASEYQLKTKDLTSYDYLHFATHGEVNMEKPALSRVFLQTGSDEDGALYTGEIFGLKLNARMVTLSACETGLGQITAGEGILGLSRAFLYAGTANLVVSQWKVADESTSQLMSQFYDNLLTDQGSPSFAHALRKAKLSIMAKDNYSLPYYWAPFILIGN